MLNNRPIQYTTQRCLMTLMPHRAPLRNLTMTRPFCTTTPRQPIVRPHVFQKQQARHHHQQQQFQQQKPQPLQRQQLVRFTTQMENTTTTTTRATTTTATTTTEPPKLDLPTAFPKFSTTNDFIAWYLRDPPTYQRFSQGWWLSNTWLMLMYAVTGSTALFMVRQILDVFGLKSGTVSLFKGEYHHRLIYFLLMTPCYSLLTLLYGRAFGRTEGSKLMVRRIWGRFIPSLRK